MRIWDDNLSFRVLAKTESFGRMDTDVKNERQQEGEIATFDRSSNERDTESYEETQKVGTKGFVNEGWLYEQIRYFVTVYQRVVQIVHVLNVVFGVGG